MRVCVSVCERGADGEAWCGAVRSPDWSNVTLEPLSQGEEAGNPTRAVGGVGARVPQPVAEEPDMELATA